jgi:exopolysaccharide biosynthesis protein
MSRRLASLAGLTVCALVVGVGPGPADADPGTSRPEADKRIAQQGPQTSDGVRGTLAPYVPRALRTPPVITNDVTWSVAPGITFRQWDQVDTRGPNRAYLLTIDPATPGVAIDYASSKSVRNRETVRHMIRGNHAIAGVNGDFYDIFDTGAPLGLGVDRERGLLHARKSGWNRTFLIKDGVPAIANLPMRAKIVQEPWMKITHYNSPTIFDGQIGVYDHRWGNTAGPRVVDGQTEDVRQVVIRDKYVVSNEPTLTNDVPVRGLVLVGRGTGADALGALRKGDKARVTWELRREPEVAISGNKVLLLGGVRRVVDDLEMHPRTAVGIDKDTGQVLMLVVDGRQDFSRGLTMVELANLMTTLGAEDALNLDGGGSSTVVAPDLNGVVGVRNSPSDGFERHVANGLQVTYTP